MEAIEVTQKQYEIITKFFKGFVFHRREGDKYFIKPIGHKTLSSIQKYL